MTDQTVLHSINCNLDTNAKAATGFIKGHIEGALRKIVCPLGKFNLAPVDNDVGKTIASKHMIFFIVCAFLFVVQLIVTSSTLPNSDQCDTNNECSNATKFLTKGYIVLQFSFVALFIIASYFQLNHCISNTSHSKLLAYSAPALLTLTFVFGVLGVFVAVLSRRTRDPTWKFGLTKLDFGVLGITLVAAVLRYYISTDTMTAAMKPSVD